MTRKTVWMAKNVVARLDVICKRDGLKFSDLIRRAVIEFLKREEAGEKGNN